jgi:hypothetical protein
MWCDVQKQHLKFIENLDEETQALKETTRWQKWISLWPKGTSQQTFGWEVSKGEVWIQQVEDVDM